MKMFKALARRIKSIFCKHTAIHVEVAETAPISASLTIKGQCIQCGKPMEFALEKYPIEYVLKHQLRDARD